MSYSAWLMIREMRCPKCGAVGTAKIVVEDDDWWSITCEECGHSDGTDPTELIPKMFPDWFKFRIEDTDG